MRLERRTFLASLLYSKTKRVRSSTSSVSENMANSPLDDDHVALLRNAPWRRETCDPVSVGVVVELMIKGTLATDALDERPVLWGGSRLVGLVLTIWLEKVAVSGSLKWTVDCEDWRVMPAWDGGLSFSMAMILSHDGAY